MGGRALVAALRGAAVHKVTGHHDEDESCEAAHRATLDPYSTAIHFRGWREAERFAVPPGYEPLPSAAPETWLLRVGWERHGRISAFDVPGRL